MEFLFWLSFLYILYTYIGYPLILFIWARVRPRKVDKKQLIPEPLVSIIIAVKNEETFIRRKLDNILLQDYEVPYYWIISPDDKTLIAYKLINKNYNIIFSIRYEIGETDVTASEMARIEPFDEIEIDLGYIFTGEKRTESNLFQ